MTPDELAVKNFIIESGIEPFLLFGYKGRKEVEIRHERDELDVRVLASLMEEYGIIEEEVEEEWE